MSRGRGYRTADFKRMKLIRELKRDGKYLTMEVNLPQEHSYTPPAGRPRSTPPAALFDGILPFPKGADPVAPVMVAEPPCAKAKRVFSEEARARMSTGDQAAAKRRENAARYVAKKKNLTEVNGRWMTCIQAGRLFNITPSAVRQRASRGMWALEHIGKRPVVIVLVPNSALPVAPESPAAAPTAPILPPLVALPYQAPSLLWRVLATIRAWL